MLGVVLALQVMRVKGKLKNQKIFRYIVWGVMVGVMAEYMYLTYMQYRSWTEGELTAKFLPPYSDISYLLSYHIIRFLSFYSIAAVIGGVVCAYARYVNKKKEEQFFEKEEPYIGFLSILLLGGPDWKFGWVMYLGVLLITYLVVHIVVRMQRKGEVRIPLYFFWVPCALITLIAVKLSIFQFFT